MLIAAFVKRSSESNNIKDSIINKTMNSAGYIQACAAVDEQNRQRQYQLDKELHDKYLQRYDEYQKATQKYNDDLLYYNRVAMPEWSQELSMLETALVDSRGALAELYSKNIIPMKYRNHAAVLWLSTYIGTSQYNLQEAISRFDHDVSQNEQRTGNNIARAQLMVAQESLRHHQYANWLHEQQIELTEQGNATLRSISNWQRADIGIRELRRIQAKRAARR